MVFHCFTSMSDEDATCLLWMKLWFLFDVTLMKSKKCGACHHARRQHRYGRPVFSFPMKIWQAVEESVIFGRITSTLQLWCTKSVWLLAWHEFGFSSNKNCRYQYGRFNWGPCGVSRVVGVVITAEFPACQYLIPQGPGPHELCTNSNCESHAAFVI